MRQRKKKRSPTKVQSSSSVKPDPAAEGKRGRRGKSAAHAVDFNMDDGCWESASPSLLLWMLQQMRVVLARRRR